MSLLSDEILNEYLDGELDKKQSSEIEEILNKSENDRKRFSALKLIHKELSLMPEDKVSVDFTNKDGSDELYITKHGADPVDIKFTAE